MMLSSLRSAFCSLTVGFAQTRRLFFLSARLLIAPPRFFHTHTQAAAIGVTSFLTKSEQLPV
jgi:hypothetical protein